MADPDFGAKTLNSTAFPFEGELFPSRKKAYRETVFFVHFYQGSKRSLLRHIRFVNGLGFDAFAFNLETRFSLFHPPITADGGWGYKHVYAAQIEQLLNLIGGEKIVFAFSNPGGAAIEALARRQCSDVKALVCDSGPSGQFLKSAYNLYRQEKKITNAFLLTTATPFLSMLWSPQLHHDLPGQLKMFPENFPVLSIRGWKDPLISPEQIDAVFQTTQNLDWRKLALPEAEHLNGLRDFASEYTPPVANFLREVATPS